MSYPTTGKSYSTNIPFAAYENGNRSSTNNAQYGVSRESFGENYGHAPLPPRHASRMNSEQAVNRYAPTGMAIPLLEVLVLRPIIGASSGSEVWTGPQSEESSLDHANGVARPVPQQQPSYSDGQYPEEEWGPPRGRPPPGPQQMMAGNGYGNGYPNGGAGGYANGAGYGNGQSGSYNAAAAGNGYASNGYNQNYGQPAYYPPNQQQTNVGPPRPPPKEARPQLPPKSVISLNNPNPDEAGDPTPQRKSWLKRLSRSKK